MLKFKMQEDSFITVTFLLANAGGSSSHFLRGVMKRDGVTVTMADFEIGAMTGILRSWVLGNQESFIDSPVMEEARNTVIARLQNQFVQRVNCFERDIIKRQKDLDGITLNMGIEKSYIEALNGEAENE